MLCGALWAGSWLGRGWVHDQGGTQESGPLEAKFSVESMAASNKAKARSKTLQRVPAASRLRPERGWFWPNEDEREGFRFPRQSWEVARSDFVGFR